MLTGTICVLGSSYCGSTLLSMYLGSHPEIVGGGEMHLLVTAKGSDHARCLVCGGLCPIWTNEARASITQANIYERTAELFRRPVVCDASKSFDWFKVAQPATGADCVNVVLVKHPVRHVASHVEKARRRPEIARYADIGTVLTNLAFYAFVDQRMRIDHFIRYEDFVADQRAAVAPVLTSVGLTFEPAMMHWDRMSHHHIGGNQGPRFQVTGRRDANMADFVHAKYQRPGIFQDESYLDILSADEIAEVMAHPLAVKICERFGYLPIP